MARHLDKATRHRLLRRAAIWGIVAGGCLVLLYVAVLGLASSFAHASEELRRLWPWMAALVGGFALQVGLFTYVRGAMRGSGATHMHGVAASGAATTLSMVACCAHHLADVLPLLGLAGAALFLARYQTTFLLVGVASNLLGLTYLVWLAGKHGLFLRRNP